jgi:hypothetical protein
VKIDDEWHHLNHLRPTRNYRMFAKMANVRNDPTGEAPIAMPRGLPDDVTRLTAIDAAAMVEDGHNHSWLSWQEVEVLSEFCEELKPMGFNTFSQFEGWLNNSPIGLYLFGDSWTRNPDGDRYFYGARGMTDLRFVFWFDN